MSRRIEDLTPATQRLARALQERMAENDVPILIYSTLRTMHLQARLFRQGRPFAEIHARAELLSDRWNRHDLCKILLGVGPQHGPKRTNAAPGQSLHNYGVAFDCAPMRNGEIVWGDSTPDDEALWSLMGRTGKEVGLEWGGDWQSFVDKPHFQLPGADWRELIKGDSND